MIQRNLNSSFRNLKREIKLYEIMSLDPRTPRIARLLLALAIIYTLSPLDIIPDFIPFIGSLDDTIIAPKLIRLALRLIPEELIDEYEMSLHTAKKKPKRKEK